MRKLLLIALMLLALPAIAQEDTKDRNHTFDLNYHTSYWQEQSYSLSFGYHYRHFYYKGAYIQGGAAFLFSTNNEHLQNQRYKFNLNLPVDIGYDFNVSNDVTLGLFYGPRFGVQIYDNQYQFDNAGLFSMAWGIGVRAQYKEVGVAAEFDLPLCGNMHQFASPWTMSLGIFVTI